ncbi:G-protein coupled receptor 35-like [Microcaecilia unicolor]|uniref:G-protein coupled receptor 35-like n=1 Tax=Microcaecilia unicolor TaxID=1415580 RepID=A0A6P7Z6C0_9AMPH|nr:G-protein coupled receptor 35-like [Microcaecilia unicolor]
MNCSNSTVGERIRLVQLALYIPIFVFGTIFNALAMWIFCCKLKKWTETRVYMTNLVISDCSLLFTIPFRLYSFHEKLGTELCTTVKIIYYLSMYMSISIITLIAIDRYVAIKYPMKVITLRSPLKAAIISGLIWIIHTAIRIQQQLQTTEDSSATCFAVRDPPHFLRPVYYAIFGYLIPFIITSFCTVEIIRTLKKKENTSSQEERSTKKVIRIVTANLLVFIICFLPLHVGNIIKFIIGYMNISCVVYDSINLSVQLARIFADSNCCLDAICYYFVAKEFWEVSSLLSKFRSPKNQTQETQTL